MKNKQKVPELFQKALETPPAACTLAGNAEVHSLVCHEHVGMYLLAIKSLLRYCTQFSVTVHDDGSLTDKDMGTLYKHIANIRVIDRLTADRIMNEHLGSLPHCQKYRSKSVNALQLFDFAYLANADKIVSLDSDSLFLKRPDRLLRWIEHEEQSILHSYEKRPFDPDGFFLEMPDDYEPDVNIGFICFYRDVVNLHLIESLLPRFRELHWWVGQLLIAVLIRRSRARYAVEAFDRQIYRSGIQGVSNGRFVFRHYFSASSPWDDYLHDAFSVLKEFTEDAPWL